MSTHACDSSRGGPRHWRRVAGTLVAAATLGSGCTPEAFSNPGNDTAALPPPVEREVDFVQDVQPILQGACLRCHGEERPKSGFSLTSREQALKGGDEGVDIVPGDSANSPLIHYVAHAVEDMEMPPLGKSEPLSDEEIGVLRAWIDQGVRWKEQPALETSGVVTPAVRWIGVSGDGGTFREFEGLSDGWGGGLEEFAMEGTTRGGDKVEVDGHVLFPGDYRVSLELARPKFGFVRAGAETWRAYYDDTGGYNPLIIPSTFDLGRDLELDVGRAWLDVGLTLPRLPTVVLGYEYQFRDGEKSTLQWGLAGGRAIYPSAKEIDEEVHILTLDLSYEVAGWMLENTTRGEWYRNATVRDNTLDLATGQRALIQQEDERVRGANTFRVEKQVADWWLCSGAYFYSRLDGDSSFNQSTLDAAGAPTFGTFWSAPRIELNSESHVISLASSFQPWRRLSVSLGVQGDNTRQDGFGPVNLDQGDPNNPFLFPVTLDSNLDRRRWSELGSLRFTAVPYTVLFADVRLDQENADQFEQELGNFPAPVLLRETAYRSNRGDWRAGFQYSQWRFLSVNAHFRSHFNESDYDHLQDSEFGSSDGYSAFITGRDVSGNGVHLSVTLKPSSRIRARLQYEIDDTRFHVDTDPTTFGGSPGGGIDAGHTRASRYGLDVTLTPWRRLRLGLGLGYQDSKTSTARNGVPSVSDYAGENWWVRATAAVIVNESTDLFASCEYGQADYGQDNYTTGLPLGARYDRTGVQVGLARRWSKRIESRLRYGFYEYNDAAEGGANSYTAHGLFASLSYRWP